MNFLRSLRVNRRPNAPNTGVICCQNRHILCALGRSGTSVLKHEGDGASPAQRVMRPVSGFYRADRVRRPTSSLLFKAIADNDGWCDAPDNANYNLPVELPFAASHEKMKRDDQLYDIGIILDWNMPNVGRSRHRGSAIFLHLCKPGFQPTEGCIAIKAADMAWLVPRLARDTRITISR